MDTKPPEIHYKPDVLTNVHDALKRITKDRKVRKPSRDPHLQERYPTRFTSRKVEEYKKVDIQLAKEQKLFEEPKKPTTVLIPDSEGKKHKFEVVSRMWAVDENEKTAKCFIVTKEGYVFSATAINPHHNEYDTRLWNLKDHKLIKVPTLNIDDKIEPFTKGKLAYEIKNDSKTELDELRNILEVLQSGKKKV